MTREGLISLDIVSLLAAFGLGSIATAIVQALLSQRLQKTQLSYNERKEDYIGLLEAYREAATNRSAKSAKSFAYWQIRCELVAPKAVRSAVQEMIDTKPGSPERFAAEAALKAAIRADLGIAG